MHSKHAIFVNGFTSSVYKFSRLGHLMQLFSFSLLLSLIFVKKYPNEHLEHILSSKHS
jgi:hypothetical protein